MSKDFQRHAAGSTSQAAVAFVEDIESMRALTAKTVPSPKETRDLSVTLRRLLVNSEIAHVAASRTGRVSIIANDFSQAYDLEREGAINYFIGGSDHSMGATICAAIATQGAGIEAFKKKMAAVPGTQKIELGLDAFVKQRVVFLLGSWIRRLDVIKYAANFGSAAHSQIPKTDDQLVVARLRNSVVLRPDGDNACKVELDEYWDNRNPREHAKFVYRSDCLNGLESQLIAVAVCLVNSPDIIRLEEIIRAEIS